MSPKDEKIILDRGVILMYNNFDEGSLTNFEQDNINESLYPYSRGFCPYSQNNDYDSNSNDNSSVNLYEQNANGVNSLDMCFREPPTLSSECKKNNTIIVVKDVKKSEAKNDMSLMCRVITENGIVIMSDSRSSKNNNSFKYEDNFQKIYYLEKEKLIISATGLNTFNEVVFYDFIDKICKEKQHAAITEIVTTLNSAFQYYSNITGYGIQVGYSLYEKLNGYITPTLISCDFAPNRDIKTDFEHKISYTHVSGVNWGTSLICSKIKLPYDDVNETCKTLYSYFTKIIELENCMKKEPVLGFPIHFAILKPDGTCVNNLENGLSPQAIL